VPKPSRQFKQVKMSEENWQSLKVSSHIVASKLNALEKIRDSHFEEWNLSFNKN
jgi:hypothetical protein